MTYNVFSGTLNPTHLLTYCYAYTLHMHHTVKCKVYAVQFVSERFIKG